MKEGVGKRLEIYFCQEAFVYYNETLDQNECVSTFQSSRAYDHNSELINQPFQIFTDVDYSKQPVNAFNFLKEWYETNFKEITETYTQEMKKNDLDEIRNSYEFSTINDAHYKISNWLQG